VHDIISMNFFTTVSVLSKTVSISEYFLFMYNIILNIVYNSGRFFKSKHQFSLDVYGNTFSHNFKTLQNNIFEEKKEFLLFSIFIISDFE